MLATWGCTTFPKPTLSLDFLGATSLDSGITFSRGSQATLFDSTGTLRYAKHNLLLQSQAFDLANWAKNNGATVTANAGVAPDGTTTADQFNGAASTSTGVFAFPAGVQSNVAYTFSVYVKNVSAATTLTIGCDANPSNAKVTFNAATGAITAAGANVTSSSVFDMGSGWYRVVVRFITTSTAPGFVIYADTGALATWLVWGAQLNITNMEGGVTSSLTTYYPTTTAAYYAPRFDYNPSTLQPRGLLIEEQRTNSIRNNTGVGAVAGTPGTLPTNWTVSILTTTGLTTSVVGTGTESGISYVDVKLAGTASGAGSFILQFEANGIIAASSGQTWAGSLYWRISAGSYNGLSGGALRVDERAGGFLGTKTLVSADPTTAALASQRISGSSALTNASTTNIVPYIRIGIDNGAAIDVTLRIGLPQLELGAFATSVIPTTTTALTRNADVATMTGTNFSSWYNASEGTLYSSVITQKPASNSATVFGPTLDNQSTANFITSTRFSSNSLTARVDDTSIAQVSATLVFPYVENTLYKTAIAYKQNDFAYTANGATPGTDATGTVPSISRLAVGFIGTGLYLNGHIQRIAYYPVRLQASQLQALTA